jgi:hypothetical protein
MAAHVQATTNERPTNAPTTHFKVGNPVYVLINVRGVPGGESHVISVAWYYYDQKVDLPNNGFLQRTTSGPATLYFSLSYPVPGVGQVRVYLDQPQSDATLAQTLTFGVYCQ